MNKIPLNHINYIDESSFKGQFEGLYKKTYESQLNVLIPMGKNIKFVTNFNGQQDWFLKLL